MDELRLAWSWGLQPGVSQTTPIVHDGVMYVANPGNVVQALDARTGDFLWEYRREMDERLRSTAQMRSLAVYQDLVIHRCAEGHTILNRLRVLPHRSSCRSRTADQARGAIGEVFQELRP